MKNFIIILFSLILLVSCAGTQGIEIGQKYEIDPYLGNAPEGLKRTIDTFFVLIRRDNEVVLCPMVNGQRREEHYYYFDLDKFQKMKPKLIQ